MKNINILLLSVFASLLIISCEDQSTFSNPSHHELELGSAIKFETSPASSFSSVADFAISGTLLDVNNNTQSYSVSIKALISGVSYNAENAFVYTSFPSEINITVSDIASVLGIDQNAISMGDFFEFYGTSTRNDGTVFLPIDPDYGPDKDNSNIGYTERNIINNSSYNTAMYFNAILACPLPSNSFVGEYELTADVQNVMYGAPTFVTPVTVTLEASSVYQRSFEIDYLTGLGFDTNDTFVLDFICGGVDANSFIPFGLSCGGGLYASGDGTPTPYDDSDDSVITVSFIDNALPDCSGYSPVPITFTLTKI